MIIIFYVYFTNPNIRINITASSINVIKSNSIFSTYTNKGLYIIKFKFPLNLSKFYLTKTFKKQCKDKFLIIKAKYYVIEPHYMEGTTPDGPVVFSGSLYLMEITK